MWYFQKMTQWHIQIFDLTYPITSMFSGRGFNQTLKDTFGEVYIEDLWTPYFTLTTDITASCCRVHTNGKLSAFPIVVDFAFVLASKKGKVRKTLKKIRRIQNNTITGKYGNRDIKRGREKDGEI